MKKICLSLDDVKGVFKVLSEEKIKSVFETRTLDFLKKMNSKYGTTFELYCTYEHGSYSMANLSDKYRTEFEENNQWMKFGFHCIDEKNDYCSDDQSHFEIQYKKYLADLERVTGQKENLEHLRLHGFQGTRNICRVLHQYGVKCLWASDDNRENYYLSSVDNQKLLAQGVFFDASEEIEFIGSCGRLEHNDSIFEQVQAKIEKVDKIPIYTHEWKMDDESVRKKVELCCKMEQRLREYGSL